MKPRSRREAKRSTEFRWSKWYVATKSRQNWRRFLKRSSHKIDRQASKNETKEF